MASNTQLIVCTFDGDAKADEARAAIQSLDEQLNTIKLGNIAILRKGADGNVTFYETEELREYSRDSTFGIVLGWLLGAANTLVGAPLGVAPGVESGAALGTEAAAARDVGFPDEALRQVGEQLHAGSSALITLVESGQSATVVAALQKLGGQILQGQLPPETLAALTGES
ncbi:MAG TPA: DUF1269 domain-containing protein [Roseiflexaceae bacterium]|nr:DUF1269 domain-containing protein [Roseiflexaceae bacterium]